MTTEMVIATVVLFAAFYIGIKSATEDLRGINQDLHDICKLHSKLMYAEWEAGLRAPSDEVEDLRKMLKAKDKLIQGLLSSPAA